MNFFYKRVLRGLQRGINIQTVEEVYIRFINPRQSRVLSPSQRREAPFRAYARGEGY